MRSGNLVSGPGFAFIINGGHSLIGGGDYSDCHPMKRRWRFSLTHGWDELVVVGTWQEYSGTFVKNVMVCNMIKLAAKILLGQDVFLKSDPQDGLPRGWTSGHTPKRQNGYEFAWGTPFRFPCG